MKRRYRTDEERIQALEVAIEFLEKNIQRSAAIQAFGRSYLYNFVRLKTGLVVSQNRLYNYDRERFPAEVQHRKDHNWKHRTEFSIPGPNFLWSLDGYEKLKIAGEERGRNG